MLQRLSPPLPFFEGLKQQASAKARQTVFYHWMLSRGDTPDRLNIKLTDPWPGNADVGRMMCHGVMVQQGMSLKIDAHFWDKVDESAAWSDILHRFTWLRDLRAGGGDTARKLARILTENWLDSYDRWDETVWRPDIMGQRLSMWISFYDFFCASADEDFQQRYFASLCRQANYLARTLSSAHTLYGSDILTAAKGLVYAGLGVPNRDAWAMQGFDLILQEIPKQIRKDGSHISGNPEVILNCAQLLLDLRYALGRANLPVPPAINTALENMARALRFFTYPDRKLGLFHGGQESEARLIDVTLSQIRDSKRPIKTPSCGGFERVMMGRSVLIIDTSLVPPSPYTRLSHSAPLSFEFVHGRDRIFTQCGAHPFEAEWKKSLAQAAAHNTLIFDQHPIHERDKMGDIIRSHGPICTLRRENKEACLIEASHDAFRGAHGVDHQRRFYLGDNGHDLRGEDRVSARVPLSKPAPITVRFHLHPRVQAAQQNDNGDIHLTLPAGSSWRFYSIGAEEVRLEPSIYLGTGTKPVKTRQIVLKTLMTGDALAIKWALQRV